MIRQEGERKLELFLRLAGSRQRVYADIKDLNIQRLKFVVVFCEPTEFDDAVRSPIAFIEIDQHAMTAQA